MESSFLKNLEIELPYDPAIPLLGIHTEESRIERDTCTPMFITALFKIARRDLSVIGTIQYFNFCDSKPTQEKKKV